MNSLTLIIIYLIAVNLIGFVLMGIDKRKAIKNAFRIPEATLFSVALVGGSIGSILGMLIFRHKTKHWSFKLGMPAILVLQLILFALLSWSPIIFRFI